MEDSAHLPAGGYEVAWQVWRRAEQDRADSCGVGEKRFEGAQWDPGRWRSCMSAQPRAVLPWKGVSRGVCFPDRTTWLLCGK